MHTHSFAALLGAPDRSEYTTALPGFIRLPLVLYVEIK